VGHGADRLLFSHLESSPDDRTISLDKYPGKMRYAVSITISASLLLGQPLYLPNSLSLGDLFTPPFF